MADSQRSGFGCVSTFVLALTMALIAAFAFATIIPQLDHDQELLDYLAQWQAHGIENYTILVRDRGNDERARLTVENGVLVNVESEHMRLGVLEHYNQYTVDGLFEKAARCYWFCQTAYDTTYGYPRRIGGWFMDSGTVRVELFTENTP